MLAADCFRRYTSKDDCRGGGGANGGGGGGGNHCSYNRQQTHYHCAAGGCRCDGAFPNLIEMRAHVSQHRSMTAVAAATTTTTTNSGAHPLAPPHPVNCLRRPPHCTKDNSNDDNNNSNDGDYDRDDRDDRDDREDGEDRASDEEATLVDGDATADDGCTAGGLGATTLIHCSRANCQFTSKSKSDLDTSATTPSHLAIDRREAANHRKSEAQFDCRKKMMTTTTTMAPGSRVASGNQQSRIKCTTSNGEEAVGSGVGAVALLSYARDWGLGLAEQRLRQALAAAASGEIGESEGDAGGYGQMLVASQAAAAAAALLAARAGTGAATPPDCDSVLAAAANSDTRGGNGAGDATSDCDSSDVTSQLPQFGTTVEYLQDMLQQHRQMMHHHHQLLLNNQRLNQQHEAIHGTSTVPEQNVAAAESEAVDGAATASVRQFPGLKSSTTATPPPSSSLPPLATSTTAAHSVQITSIDGFFNRKRGRPPKNRFVEVYKNTQQSPQAIFTSFKLEKQGGGVNTVLMAAPQENAARMQATIAPPAPSAATAGGVNVLEAQRMFLRSLTIQGGGGGGGGGDDLAPSNSRARSGLSQTEQSSNARSGEDGFGGATAATTSGNSSVACMQRILQRHGGSSGGSGEKPLHLDCTMEACRRRTEQPHLHCRRCRQEVSPFDVDAHMCRQQLTAGHVFASVCDQFLSQRPSTAAPPTTAGWVQAASAPTASDECCDEPIGKKAKRVSVVRAAGTFYPENSSCGGAAAALAATSKNAPISPSQTQPQPQPHPPNPPTAPTVTANVYGGTQGRRRRTQPPPPLPSHSRAHAASTHRQRHQSLLQRTSAPDDDDACNEMPQDLSINAAARQQHHHQHQQQHHREAEGEPRQRQRQLEQAPHVDSRSGGLAAIISSNSDNNSDERSASFLGMHMKDMFEFYRQRLHQQLQQTLQRHQQHLAASGGASTALAAGGSVDGAVPLQPPPPQELASVLNVASAFIEAATASAVAASVAAAANVGASATTTTTSGSGSGSGEKRHRHHQQRSMGAAAPAAAPVDHATLVAASASATATAQKLKDDRIPTGYLKFRFNEDCAFPRCGYRNRQSHFHCNRVDCHYSFCDKTRFVQHTARHERLDTLMGDDFQQFRANMTCGYTNCPYATTTTTTTTEASPADGSTAAKISAATAAAAAVAAAAAAASKKSSHFHCLKCAFICSDTNKVVAHRRLHSKMEYIRMAGFRKVSSNENCSAEVAATAASEAPSTGEACSYSFRHTHYHCLVCDCSVLSRAQLASHRHRATTTTTTAATLPSSASGQVGGKAATSSAAVAKTAAPTLT